MKQKLKSIVAYLCVVFVVIVLILGITKSAGLLQKNTNDSKLNSTEVIQDTVVSPIDSIDLASDSITLDSIMN
jgi:hypothetical protein